METLSQQHFMPRLDHPATTFAIACVTVSLIAIASVWKSYGSPAPERTLEQRPQPPKRRRAVDSMYFESRPSLGPSVRFEQPKPNFAKLVAKCAEVSQRLRAPDADDGARFTIASLLSELSLTMTTLCRIQKAQQADADAMDDSVGLLEALTAGLAATLSIIESEVATSYAGADGEVLAEVLQQLRDQRPTLSFLLECTERPANTGSGFLQPPDLAETSVGFTPGEDLKTWIDSPPEYSPPSQAESIPIPEKSQAQPAPEVSVTVHNDSTTSPLDEDLYQAVVDNDVKALSQLLERGADLHSIHGSLQRTPLHQAAELNHDKCLSVLLRHGAVTTTEDSAGDTPLHLAAWSGHVEAASTLLAQGADTDWLSGRDGYSPLWCAVTARHIDVARLLLRKGARVSLRSGGGMMPLHQAAVTSQTAMCELLLERGASVDPLDGDENTPLHYAAVSGEVATVRLLVNHGAELDRRQSQGLTPLMWAAHKGHSSVVKVLIDFGASVDATTHDHATALHCAANRGHITSVRTLLESGADTSIEASSWNGVSGSAAEMARAKGHEKVADVIEDFPRN